MNALRLHTAARRRRGATLLFCIGTLVVVGGLAMVASRAYVSGRLAQRRAEIVRAERLLLANTVAFAEAAAARDAITQVSLVVDEGAMSIDLFPLDYAGGPTRFVGFEARGIHPLAAVEGALEIGGASEDGASAVRVVRWAPDQVGDGGERQ